jgi:hypothetical protein
MRCIATAFVLLLPLLAAAAEDSVVWVDLYVGTNLAPPDDLKYLAGVKGAARSVHVRLHQSGTNASRNERITVSGALTKAQVTTLLQAVFGSDKKYWSPARPLSISITGDEYRARVSTKCVPCGSECIDEVSYLYTHDEAGWHYLYTFNPRVCVVLPEVDY